MLLVLLSSLALAGTWHNGNVDLPETLEEILTVEFAGKITVSAESDGGTVTFSPQPLHMGACAEGEDRGGLRYTACLRDGRLVVSVRGGEPSAVSVTIRDRSDKPLYSSALTAQAEVQRENTPLRR